MNLILSMNYVEAKEYLFSLGSFEREASISQRNKGFDLEHYRNFLAKLGNPQDGISYVHVAGSKGKGSTSNFIAAGLAAHSNKVGLFTSPAILDLREQITISGEWISESDFVRFVKFIKSKLEEFDTEISYFEFINTIAFLYFKEKKVDFAVLEVGLGGLYDSTNVVNPLITVLTQIEFEHKDVLGESLEEILDNKLGIMKSGVQMVVSPQKYDLVNQIEKKAKSLDVEVLYVDDVYNLEKIDVNGTFFDGHKINMIGTPYILSAKTAFKVCGEICDGFDENLFWDAVQNVTMPARFEVFEKDGNYVVFDMAHTVEGAKYLRATLNDVFPNQKFTFLVSMLKDKDVEKFCYELICDKDEIVVTQATISRAMSANELAEKISRISNVVEDPVEAFNIVLQKKEILVATGSHFLLHDLYSLI